MMSSGENAELGTGRGSRVREVYTGALGRLYPGGRVAIVKGQVCWNCRNTGP